MVNFKQFSLLLATTFWGILIGGVVYSHIVFFPKYLHHLPESNSLLNGEYGLNEATFWMFIHPITILATIIALVLNRKFKARKKYISIALIIYVLAIIATAVYFVPTLLYFADSSKIANVSSAELLQKGKTWEQLSWIRGAFMFIGFLLMQSAMLKNDSANSSKF